MTEQAMAVVLMKPEERRERITSLVREASRVSVDELAGDAIYRISHRLPLRR